MGSFFFSFPPLSTIDLLNVREERAPPGPAPSWLLTEEAGRASTEYLLEASVGAGGTS